LSGGIDPSRDALTDAGDAAPLLPVCATMQASNGAGATARRCTACEQPRPTRVESASFGWMDFVESFATDPAELQRRAFAPALSA
jgi:hypothetical protein